MDHRLHDGLHPLRNPLSSEAEAFRFLGAVIVGALVVVGAAKIDMYAGIAAAVAAIAGITFYLRH